MNRIITLPLALVTIALPATAFAQNVEYATLAETTFIFNTLLFLIGGFLVFWMAAGFAMLEAGLVRSKNVTMQLTKNIALFGIAAIMYWLVGYNLMYPGDAWIIDNVVGTIGAKDIKSPADGGGYSNAADFFFQLMFCATAASIVSGTLAERIKLWPFLIFVVVLTGFIYPIEASWQWGAGFLAGYGFSDFAGSAVVHAAGGFAALAGAIVLGPRLGKYARDGRVVPMPGSNLPLATLGTFILWMGWFGFNGASQLAMGTLSDANAVAQIFANTNMAAAAGAIASLLLTQVLYGKTDLTMVLNGALAGLVSITAEPLAPSLFDALWIGAVGGAIVVFTVPMLDRLRIDDVVGAIPVHLIAGIWGTLIVALHTRAPLLDSAGEPVVINGVEQTAGLAAQLMTQLIGITAIGTFVFGASMIVWIALDRILGIRVGEEEEITGLDMSELGMEAYPEFSH